MLILISKGEVPPKTLAFLYGMNAMKAIRKIISASYRNSRVEVPFFNPFSRVLGEVSPRIVKFFLMIE